MGPYFIAPTHSVNAKDAEELAFEFLQDSIFSDTLCNSSGQFNHPQFPWLPRLQSMHENHVPIEDKRELHLERQ